jgi:hypothetical protein
MNIPGLGRARARTLAAAGINTVEDLQRAPIQQLQGLSRIGRETAERIKAWAAEQPVDSAPAAPRPAVSRGPQRTARTASAYTEADVAPAAEPASAEGSALAASSARVGDAVEAVIGAIRDQSVRPRLRAQIERLTETVLNIGLLAGSLPAQQQAALASRIDRASDLLVQAAGGKISRQRQADLAAAIQKARRRLARVVAG